MATDAQLRRTMMAAFTRMKIDTSLIVMRISAGRVYCDGCLHVLTGMQSQRVTRSEDGHRLLRCVEDQIRANRDIQLVLFNFDGWVREGGRWVYTKSMSQKKEAAGPRSTS